MPGTLILDDTIVVDPDLMWIAAPFDTPREKRLLPVYSPSLTCCSKPAAS
jgi:hypothetical protein